MEVDLRLEYFWKSFDFSVQRALDFHKIHSNARLIFLGSFSFWCNTRLISQQPINNLWSEFQLSQFCDEFIFYEKITISCMSLWCTFCCFCLCWFLKKCQTSDKWKSTKKKFSSRFRKKGQWSEISCLISWNETVFYQAKSKRMFQNWLLCFRKNVLICAFREKSFLN